MPKLPTPPTLPPPKSKIPIFSLTSTRLRIGLLLMTGLFCGTSMRVNLSMGIVCMVNSTAFEYSEPINLPPNTTSILTPSNDTFSTPPTTSLTNVRHACRTPVNSERMIAEGYSGDLLWSPEQVSLLLSATFYGGLFTSWWSGYLADRLGPKMVLLAAIANYVVMTLLTPVLANISFYAVFIARFIMGLGEGFIFPSISSTSARWFPPSERSTFAAIYTSGNQLATVIGLPLSSYLCGASYLGGWPSIFYLFASFGSIWIIFWIFFSSNIPEKNSFISEEEILYIRQQTSGQSTNTKIGSSKLSTAPVPWLHIVSSTAVLANIVAQFSFNFSASLLQTYLPTYMKQVLRVDIGKNGLYAMLPFLTQMISKNIFGILSDGLKRHGVLNATTAVRLFQLAGNIGGGLCFLILGLFIDCEKGAYAVFILGLYGVFFSAGICGFFTSLLCIAPQFTGTLTSISMFAGTLGNAISPGLVGLINKHGTEEEWKYIWLLTAGANFIAASVYFIFGTAEIQEWAKPIEIPTSADKISPTDAENQIQKRDRRISEISTQDFNT